MKEFNKHYNFEQLKNVRDTIANKISDFIKSADIYELICLECEIESLKRKK